MELLLVRPAEFERLYSGQCSRIRVDHVPLEKRMDMANGIILILLFIITEVLYIPCMCAIWRRMGDNSCYKLLFYIGVTDMLVLWVVAFFSGYFALTGTVFCTNPVLDYVLGAIGTSLWAAESTAELLLAMDRCLEMSFPEIAENVFGGYRAWLWTLLTTIYSLYWLFFNKPAIFSSIYCAWFFNPFIGYIEDTENIYQNYVHLVHNTFLAFAFPLLYLLLGIKLALASQDTAGSVQRNVCQKMMFLQVALISFFNCYSCILYVLMQFIRVNGAVILLAHYGWLIIHGIPPFIYLTINRTIRDDCRQMAASLLHRMTKNIHGPSASTVGIPRKARNGSGIQANPAATTQIGNGRNGRGERGGRNVIAMAENTV